MAFGNVIQSFAFAPLNPTGITFDGKNLLVTRADVAGLVHSIDRATGAIVNTFSKQANCYGLHYDSGKVFQTRGGTDQHVLYCDVAGNLIRDLGAIPGAVEIYGMDSLDDGTLIVTDYNQTEIWFIERSDATHLIRSWDVGFVRPYGCAFDGEFIYVVDYFSFRIVKFDVDGRQINTASVPQRPLDLTYDGKYLWVTNDLTDRIYCVSVN